MSEITQTNFFLWAENWLKEHHITDSSGFLADQLAMQLIAAKQMGQGHASSESWGKGYVEGFRDAEKKFYVDNYDQEHYL